MQNITTTKIGADEARDKLSRSMECMSKKTFRLAMRKGPSENSIEVSAISYDLFFSSLRVGVYPDQIAVKNLVVTHEFGPNLSYGLFSLESERLLDYYNVLNEIYNFSFAIPFTRNRKQAKALLRGLARDIKEHQESYVLRRY